MYCLILSQSHLSPEILKKHSSHLTCIFSSMSADAPAGYSESNKQEIITANIKSLRLSQTVMLLQPKSHVGVGYHLSQIRGQRLNKSCDPPGWQNIIFLLRTWTVVMRNQMASDRQQKRTAIWIPILSRHRSAPSDIDNPPPPSHKTPQER